MGRKHKPATEVGFLQKMNQHWRACAKGKQGREYTPLWNTKKEALADLSKAREGAIYSTDVARGLAAVRKQKLAAKIGSLQKIVHKSQAYAKRQLRNTEKKKRMQIYQKPKKTPLTQQMWCEHLQQYW